MAASTTPEIALGATLKYDAVGASTFAAGLGRVRDINGLEISCDKVDVTSMDDTIMKYLAGISTEEDRRISLVYDEASMAIIYSFYKVEKNWKITTAGSATWIGTGFIQKIGQPLQYRGAIVSEIVIVPTSTWTYTGTA